MVINKQIIAIIPARGGSKRIFKKNIKFMAGKPLIAYTIEASLNSELIDKTIVSTDDEEISDVAKDYGAEVIMRPKGLSKDDSPTEQAMLQVIEQLEKDGCKIDYIVLLQPTSPLRGTDIIDKGINIILESDADSLLSVCEVRHYYLLGYFDKGYYKPEYDKRPFSHTMPKKYKENGAIYITKKDFLIKNKNRIGGKIKAIVMNEVDSIDIDEEGDFDLVERIILNAKSNNSLDVEQLKKIKLFITDVDGVLTDGGMYYSEEGEVMKEFNTRDGMGIELLRKNRIIPVIITKENSEIVIKRAEKLKVKEAYIGVEDKLEVIEELIEKYNLSFDEIAYIGDDINDLPVLEKAGLSFAPEDAIEEVKQSVDYVTSKKGGEGAFREAVDFILAQNLSISHSAETMTKSSKIVSKPWGREIWIAEEEEYAGKLLEINKGAQTSLHYHAKKKETLYVLEGVLNIELLDGSIKVVNTGGCITFNPGDVHRLKAIDDVKIFEVSTPQLDDVFRLKDSYKRL